ncbi:MAG: ATP-binding cassette domain-containing protein [Christensenellaceae bacterium]
MTKFDDQIKNRIKNDDADFHEAFSNMAGVVMDIPLGDTDERKNALSAIGEVLRYYRIKATELPKEIEDLDEQLDYLLRPAGMMRRAVRLEDDWYKDAMGAMLGQTTDGTTVAILPHAFTGYMVFYPATAQKVRVTKKVAAGLSKDAVCFYKPLPQKEIGTKELVRYIVSILNRADLFFVALTTLLVTLVGLLPPMITKLLFGDVLQGGSAGVILPIVFFLIGATTSAALISVAKSIILTRIKTKLDVMLEAAGMMRTLSLPTEFFAQFSSGEIATRLQNLSEVCNMLLDALLTSGLTALFSLVYVVQIFGFAPELALPAAIIIFATAAITVAIVVIRSKILKKQMDDSAKTDGLVFALITGIQKIKTAGAEKRAFARWAGQYTKVARLQYDPPTFLKIGNVIISAISLVGVIVIYYSAINAHIAVSDYMGFNATYGMLSGAFASLSTVAVAFAYVNPVLDMIKPFFKTVPETTENKKMVTSLGGKIEVDNVSFRYTEDTPMVLDNLTIKVDAGQYVGIVGKTGCGKSTLLRLLIGFETACKGAVYYDERDIKTLDLPSLRRKIGVVIQDGKLFAGDIFSNIAITSPNLTVKEAWEAAEIAGIADDIREMPMGMNTVISEGSGGVSGGQKQRIMIARAVASKPRILLFDEATSALDNITQRNVSEALARLDCTRIVIAHRLSTIKECDRIIVLGDGHIVEDGTYTELCNQKGYFAELIKRQQIDMTE